jgi:phosphoglycolate phosphatase-like HAD superfamily hydrolase
MPASEVAEQLRGRAAARGVDVTDVCDQEDPLEVLRWAGRRDAVLLAVIEDALIRAEVAAVPVAEPRPSAHELLEQLRRRGMTIGIASNNSEPAIRAYLARHDLNSTVGAVAGRRPYEPWTMKPSTTCLAACLAQLHATADQCVCVGDSVTDIQAAHDLFMSMIGFANTPGKAATLSAAGADAVISDVAELLSQSV